MSQSPLSRAIRELERELGLVLFVRTTRHVELTPAGSVLLERARRALGEVDAAIEEARRATQPDRGVLAVGNGPFSRAAATRIVGEAAAAYERSAVPETGQILYEAGFANFHLHPPTEVHFKNAERAPLLIVGAEKDNTVPASLARKQYEKYERSPAATEYVEFEGRPHLLMAAEGWDEVAASIDSWLDGVLDAPVRQTQGASV